MPSRKTADTPLGTLSTGTARAYLRGVLVAVLLAVFARTFLVQGLEIRSGSMADTLLVGDYVLINRFRPRHPPLSFAPMRRPRRGEVVVLRQPGSPDRLVVKRCVGLPGERIRIVDGRVLANGRAVGESPSVSGPTESEVSSFEIPPDHYFVLGDRRASSLDSRDWGAVPAGQLVGSPVLVYWSWGGARADRRGPSVGHLLRVARRFLSDTRWERMGRLVR